MKQKKNFFSTVMTAPALIILVLLSAFPLAYTIKNSFTDAYLLAPDEATWIGLKNYITILNDEYFQMAAKNTIKFTIFAVAIETILGLMIAIFVHSFQKGTKIIRILVLLPMLLPPVTVALIWQTMFSNNYGIINQILGYFQLNSINWLMDVKTAFYSLLIIDVWQYTPLTFLLIYASLQGVPESQYESASIEGAGTLEKFIYITLPNIKDGLEMVLLLRIIDTLRLFDKVNILTKGGPANTTATITQYIYQYSTKNLKIGYASAASVIMTIMVLLLSAVYLKKSLEAKE